MKFSTFLAAFVAVALPTATLADATATSMSVTFLPGSQVAIGEGGLEMSQVSSIAFASASGRTAVASAQASNGSSSATAAATVDDVAALSEVVWDPSNNAYETRVMIGSQPLD